MLMYRQKHTGFTIVELLIVVVVIAILAAISIVAYAGISNRANDSAVQNDLRNFANKVMEYHALSGQYPAGSVVLTGGSSYGPLQNFESFPFARSSYDTSVNNVYYCERNGIFAVGATSKSGNRFYFRSGAGVASYTDAWTNADGICPRMLGTGTTAASASGATVSYAFRQSDGQWSAMAR